MSVQNCSHGGERLNVHGPSGRRGTVVRVVADGVFVTVRWLRWIGLESYENTHGPSDLVRLTGA